MVVDTNVVGYLFLASDRSEFAERVLRRDPVWAAPLLWRSELQNVLALYVRREILTLVQANAVMEKAIALMRGHEYAASSAHVLRLAAASGCSAYDCEFVAVAQDLGVRLITVDGQILRRFPEISVSLAIFGAPF